jgi:hypothetical protein
VVETLLDDESAEPRLEERLDETARQRERRITALFHRWGALSNSEIRELRRLWDERVRRAKARRIDAHRRGRALSDEEPLDAA